MLPSASGGGGPLDRHVFIDQDMAEGQVLQVEGRAAWVYSARCPGVEGPNQDAAGVVSGRGRAALVVADGMGGQAGGESASRIALTSLCDRASEAVSADEDLRGPILDSIEEANRKIMALGIGAATTLAAVELKGDELRAYHVGDSAILVVGQRGKLKLRTIAHSPVGYALEAGLLDEKHAMQHEERHLVSNMVGSTDMRIEVGSPIRLAPRDTVVLGSDGLFDNLSLREIVDDIRTGPVEQGGAALAAHCRKRMATTSSVAPSKPDDCTFIVLRGH